jgi:hypothetical protein
MTSRHIIRPDLCTRIRYTDELKNAPSTTSLLVGTKPLARETSTDNNSSKGVWKWGYQNFWLTYTFGDVTLVDLYNKVASSRFLVSNPEIPNYFLKFDTSPMAGRYVIQYDGNSLFVSDENGNRIIARKFLYD